MNSTKFSVPEDEEGGHFQIFKNGKPFTKAESHCADEDIPLVFGRVDTLKKFTEVSQLMERDEIYDVWIALEKKTDLTTVKEGTCFMTNDQVLKSLQWSVADPDVTSMDWLSQLWHFDDCTAKCIHLHFDKNTKKYIFADGMCSQRLQVLCERE